MDDDIALSQRSWIDTLHRIEAIGPDRDMRDMAGFTAGILERCGPTRALRDFLDQRALSALSGAS